MFDLGLSDTILSALTLGLGALCVFLGLRVWSVSESLETAETEREALAADTARLGQSIRQLRASIEVQNDSVAALRRKAQSLRRRIQSATDRAEALRREAERRAQIVLSERRSLGCDKAIEWAGREADSLTSTW